MLLERGIVSSVSTNTLSVTCRSKIDCIRCAEGKGCGGGILARWLGDRQFSIQAHYTVDTQTPKVGDFVAIALPASRVVKLAATMYALPILLMLLFLILQVLLFPEVHELVSIVLAILALFLGFRLARFLVNQANRQGLLLPRLLSEQSLMQVSPLECKNK